MSSSHLPRSLLCIEEAHSTLLRPCASRIHSPSKRASLFVSDNRDPRDHGPTYSNFVRKICRRKLLLQALDFVVGDGDFEGGDPRHGEVGFLKLDFGLTCEAKLEK